jgi:hypothetical protein
MPPMKPVSVALGLLLAFGGVTAAVYWQGGASSTVPEDTTVARGAGRGSAETLRGKASRTGGTNPQTAAPSRNQGPAIGGEEHTAATWSGVVRSVPATATANGRSVGGRATTSGSSSGTPRVSARLAFKALLYVGVDPEAEKTWMQAINDPKLPAGVRSDLIEDLNDEGYEDPSGNQITKRDLPLILARMEIIERLAPYAMDKVNADAFEEAYKDLLNMYVRLKSGGE